MEITGGNTIEGSYADLKICLIDADTSGTLTNDTTVTPTDTIDVSQGKSIVDVDNVIGDFNNDISDVLANFATNGSTSTTDDFRSLLADDSEY